MSVKYYFSLRDHMTEMDPAKGSRLEGPADPEGSAEAIILSATSHFHPATLFRSRLGD